jgi:hypothetical protein
MLRAAPLPARGEALKRKRFQCKYCGLLLPAWLPAAKRPNGAMLLTHLSPSHRAELAVQAWLDRMRTEDIATVAAEAFEVVEADETP